MKLQEMFTAQAKLKEHINYSSQDRFDKSILGLFVEIGECANEWRGFKYWSKDQKPRTQIPVTAWGEPYKNPLLEEYVDGLALVLFLGIELKATHIYAEVVNFNIGTRTKRSDPLTEFKKVFRWVDKLDMTREVIVFQYLLSAYTTLGDALGFNEEQVEQAFFEKNAINHERQNNSY